MAILKVAKSGTTIAALRKAVNYAAKDARAEDNALLCCGVNCSSYADEALTDMLTTKFLANKKSGRQYKHYIQSFGKGEIVPEKANEVGRQLAEKMFGEDGLIAGHECFIGTHVNSKSGVIHNHIIVNSVNFDNYGKLHLSKLDLNALKSLNDEVCRENGLSVIERQQVSKRKRIQAYSNEKYNVIKNRDKSSYLQEAARSLGKVLKSMPSSFNELFARLDKAGWKAAFRGDKHITLVNTADTKQKVRVNTLAKTFNKPEFMRENLEKVFENNKTRGNKHGYTR